MTREQFVTLVEEAADFEAIVRVCNGVGVILNPIADKYTKLLQQYLNYVDPEKKGLPVVMFFIKNGYYPIPDTESDTVFELRDISKLYDFWLVCVEHGNPASQYIIKSIDDYKKDLQ